jgi:hypothetical protein
VVAIAAGESLENGPTPLRFLRSKTHVGPSRKSLPCRGYTSRIYAGRLGGATPLHRPRLVRASAAQLWLTSVKAQQIASSRAGQAAELRRVRQSVEVTAESVFGVAARALSALRRDAWLDGIGPATRLGLNKIQPGGRSERASANRADRPAPRVAT